jgi:uroporphyrinogen decarboxylase
MNSEERVINSLKRMEVDRIPTFEWSIDKKVINKMINGASEEEFIYKMDIDAFVIEIDYIKKEIEPGVFRDEWGTIERSTGEAHTISSKGCIKTIDDFKKYNPPDPYASYRYKTIEEMILKHKDKKAVIVRLNDVFSIPRNLLGYEDLFINIASNPALIQGLIDMSIEYNTILAQEVVKRGVKIIFTGDDYAYDRGLLISPKSFDSLFYPGFKKIIKNFKDLGLLVIKHTDGDIWKIIDQLVDSGIDCIDPIDPSGGMQILDVKEKYGDRVALKGNVDCAHTLSFGSVDEVVAETKKCIKDGGPGYGYILSSSNTIHSAVQPENYKAMLETLMEFGNYPIQIP